MSPKDKASWCARIIFLRFPLSHGGSLAIIIFLFIGRREFIPVLTILSNIIVFSLQEILLSIKVFFCFLFFIIIFKQGAHISKEFFNGALRLNVKSFQVCSHRQTFRWSNVPCFNACFGLGCCCSGER